MTESDHLIAADQSLRGSAPLITAAASESLWRQAASLLAGEIESGLLPPGSRLPSERKLCEQLQISRATLRKALAQLVNAGLVNSSHGRGWFVCVPPSDNEWPTALESFSETARRKGLTASSTVVTNLVSPANLNEADRLKVAAGTPLFRLERVRQLDGIPVAIDDTALPLALAPGLPDKDFASLSLYQELADSGLVLDRAEASIEAHEADDYVAAHLGIDVGKPILVLDQITYDPTARPILSSVVRYSGDRYRLHTTFIR